MISRWLLFSMVSTLLVCGSDAMAGAPRSFDVKPGSVLRVWITQEVGGVVQPPSMGQPASVSALSGSVTADQSGAVWTLMDVDMVAADLTVSFLYPMTNVSFVNTANLVGVQSASTLELMASSCSGCSDFDVDFGYTFGTRPPVAQPFSDPLQLVMGLDMTMSGDVLTLSGIASDGFTAIFQNAVVGPAPLPLWIELDMTLIEVPVEPTELFDVVPGSEVRIYQTAIVGGKAQPPAPGQPPDAVSSLTGALEGNRDVDFWSFTLVDLEASDTSITLPVIGTVALADMTFDMPFAGVPDSDGVPRTVSQVNGLETAGVLSVAETACAGCTDFAASFGFTLGSLSPNAIALIEPVQLDVSMDGSGTTLSGDFATGTVLHLMFDVGLWVEGDIDLMTAPEPSRKLLAGSALLCIAILSRRRRRRDRLILRSA